MSSIEIMGGDKLLCIIDYASFFTQVIALGKVRVCFFNRFLNLFGFSCLIEITGCVNLFRISQIFDFSHGFWKHEFS